MPFLIIKSNGTRFCEKNEPVLEKNNDSRFKEGKNKPRKQCK